jgi:redox-sensitive bicupin YhaK (pirin superfamily)
MNAFAIRFREHDLGHGLIVRRSLPSMDRRGIGPFVFFDHAGPVVMGADEGRHADVRPHPHIGLSTVSYLFGGAVRHRDNLGFDQVIKPGDINWMTAGRGIVHSERFDTPGAFAGRGLELLQTWIALPEDKEEIEPCFSHHDKANLPEISESGVQMRVLLGEAFGAQSPVPVHSPMFYVHAELEAGRRIALPDGYSERGAYVVRGTVSDASGTRYGRQQLLAFDAGAGAWLRAESDASVMLLGGEPLGPRFMWWNLVSSSKERIRQAAEDWKLGRFPLPTNDDQEFIPLPDKPIS